MISAKMNWKIHQWSLANAIHLFTFIVLIIRTIHFLGGSFQFTRIFVDEKTAGFLDVQAKGLDILRNALHGKDDVKVFVYPLPRKFNTLQVKRSHQRPAPIRDPYCDKNFYSAEVSVHRALLRSSSRTKNAGEADFFYVPIYVTCFLINNHPNNLTKTGVFFEEGMHHIIHKYAYFNNSQGRDHVYTFAQGFGARLSGEHWNRWRNGIFLTHNGDFKSEEYTPRKDIVIPPDLRHYIVPVYADTVKRNSLILENRRFLAHFGGQSFSSSISDHRGKNYSGGVRQHIASELYKVPGFRVTGTRSNNYLEDMHDSMFCLAPEGWHPWSPRPYYGLLLGCVPVVLSERQELAFEDVVPYDDIVVWVRPDDVFSLNSILRSIDVHEIYRRVLMMERVWSLYWYGKSGLAIDAILAELYRHKYGSHPKRKYQLH